jgi:hypothetical protein
MIKKLVKQGFIKHDDKRFLDLPHDYGQQIKASDYVNHHASDDDAVSYSSDEVHDDRSFIIGYYRKKPKSVEHDEELKQYYQKCIEKPEEVQEQLETNVSRFPSNIHNVLKIAVGQEHMIALVNEDNQPNLSIYGMGSNCWGQLGKNPFKHAFVENMHKITLRILS